MAAGSLSWSPWWGALVPFWRNKLIPSLKTHLIFFPSFFFFFSFSWQRELDKLTLAHGVEWRKETRDTNILIISLLFQFEILSSSWSQTFHSQILSVLQPSPWTTLVSRTRFSPTDSRVCVLTVFLFGFFLSPLHRTGSPGPFFFGWVF